jgi:radical SAM superfamily enzyme YgiQ (UPF0313 family)/GT2 family glycosyltransferase
MRVCLINTPSLTKRAVSRSMAGGLGFDGADALLLPPLDLAFMAATLRAAGHAVGLIDADPLRLDDDAVYARLADAGWEAFIATVSLPTLAEDTAFIAGLRQDHPDAKIVAKTLVRDPRVLREILTRSGADLVLHGEGDLTIPAILAGEVRDGTAYLEHGELVFREGAPVEDLDALPLPARDLLPNDRYVYPLLGTPVATLQTSRGCPYPCGYYCPYPLVEGKAWRAQSPERVVEELRDVVERHGIRKIYFRDATFTLDRRRTSRLCALIREAGLAIEWMCETRIDCLPDELLEEMAAAGCVGMLVGVETGDETVMHTKEGKKGLTVPKLAQVRQKTRALGMRLHFLLIVGLPQETRQSIVDTYDLVQRHDPDTIGVTVITPYPGTPLHADAERAGWIESQEWRDYGGHQIVMRTPHLARPDLARGKAFIEGGFALLARARREGPSPALTEERQRHRVELLAWAHGLEAVRQRAERKAAALTAKHEVPLSVVIPTYNRRDTLRKTLLAFSAQTVDPAEFEVIVVDDGSSDDALAMLERVKTPFALRVVPQPHRGPNWARNAGIEAARGWLVLFTGDDMIPGPDFVENHLKFHRAHPVERDACLGLIEWSPEIAVTPLMRHIVSPEGGQQFDFTQVRDGKAEFNLFYTSNVSLKRSLLVRQERWFDTDFTYPACDDIELGYRLRLRGMELHHVPTAVTYHHHAITTASFVERQRMAGRMSVLLARKHPPLDNGLVRVSENLASPDRPDGASLERMLAAVTELEKPDLGKLDALRVNGEGFAEVYRRSILTPLYATLLAMAYRVGVHEGATEPFDVSIVVPLDADLARAQQTLVRLAEVTAGAHFEVVIVDDAADAATRAFLDTLGGDVRVVQNAERVGLVRACNQAARVARGRFLAFMPPGTLPAAGWLPALVAAAQVGPGAAVVGSRLAGAPATPRASEVPAVPLAGMLVARDRFDAVGGFEEGCPAATVVVDLCARLRARGERVLEEPASVMERSVRSQASANGGPGHRPAGLEATS